MKAEAQAQAPAELGAARSTTPEISGAIAQKII